jgi:SAM-dependent methyltransferase
VRPVLALGDVPLVNAFRDAGDDSPEPRFPLDVVRCATCTLVQLADTVAPEVLFRDYSYFSSYSDTFLEHARAFADEAVRRLRLGRDSFVVEAASNDGYLLQYFVRRRLRVLGVEPARNVAAVAQARGVPTIAEFLDEALAARIVQEHGPADLVVANNVLAHVPDPGGFIAALRTLSGDGGVVSVEVPYVRELVDRVEFDTIYHEHVSYFSLTALTRLVEPRGLRVVAVERLPVHGGSLRVSLCASEAPDATVADTLAAEEQWGVEADATYDAFADAVATRRREVHELVADIAASGATVAAYGAAAKGVVLANVCGLDATLVRFAADRNPHKQGKVFPGVRIPVVPPETLDRERPDYCLLFAWNLAEEILRQQAGYRAHGGRFIVPLPAPAVLAA